MIPYIKCGELLKQSGACTNYTIKIIIITIIRIIVASQLVVVVEVVDEMAGFLLEHLTFPDLPVSAVLACQI